jgi:endonuclease YncB( thermonuclease family)
MLALLVLISLALAEPLSGSADRVHDGDTLTLSGERIRLFGIDAPELAQMCRRGVVINCVPCGKDAQKTLEKIASEGGDHIICEPRGRSWNRTVARCARGEVDLALSMLESGHAIVSGNYIRERDPIRARYYDAEARARRFKLGIWSGTFISPDRWRKGDRLECER